MKKMIILIACIALAGFINAQQAPAPSEVKKASPVLNVDARPVPTANVPVVKNAEPAKAACCQGKTAAECLHGKKECSKKGESKAACCQKSGAEKACNHAHSEKTTEAKPQ